MVDAPARVGDEDHVAMVMRLVGMSCRQTGQAGDAAAHGARLSVRLSRIEGTFRPVDQDEHSISSAAFERHLYGV